MPTGSITQEPVDVFSGVLLSHGLRRSTISAGGLNFRVRNGIGCTPSAITTEHIHRFSVNGTYAVFKCANKVLPHPESCIALEDHTNEIKTSAN